MVNALILKGPGTNCDVETRFACERVGFEARVTLIGEFLRDSSILDRTALFIVPGGFSYGDDLGAGTVMGNQLRLVHDRLWNYIRTGGLVLGICNGFQILTRAGLLPDPMSGEQTVSLSFNESGRYEDRWVRLKIVSTRSVFLRQEGTMELPVAHAEGRFVVRDEGLLDLMKKNGQVVLQYVDEFGAPARYPGNPNGSLEGVAGICDSSGRVLGLMPHPERFQDLLQHPRWTRRRPREGEGLQFFRNAFDYCSRHPR
jgi:phosphoribosylformylglycinamidine synthase